MAKWPWEACNEVDVADVVVLRAELAAFMHEVAKLEERKQYVIAARLGLLPRGPSTLDAIGRALGVTRERVRQIEAQARRQLASAYASYEANLTSSQRVPPETLAPSRARKRRRSSRTIVTRYEPENHENTARARVGRARAPKAPSMASTIGAAIRERKVLALTYDGFAGMVESVEIEPMSVYSGATLERTLRFRRRDMNRTDELRWAEIRSAAVVPGAYFGRSRQRA
jgi:Sigma-70, region 4